MQKLIFIAAAMLAFSTVAQADVIPERQAIMKSIGSSVGLIGPMLKGEKPFDGPIAIDALNKIRDNADKVDVAALFPEGSDKGETEALPEIWQDMADFTARIEKFQQDAGVAAAANPQDLDQLKASFQQVAANCGSCHQLYRVKK